MNRDYRKGPVHIKAPGAQPKGGRVRVVGRYLHWVGYLQDALPISNQVPTLSTGPRNASVSGRTPPLSGPQVSALTNCLSEAAGRERARRNPSAEPDPASAVGLRGAADHPQRGRQPCCALAWPGPHEGLRIPGNREGTRGTQAEVQGRRRGGNEPSGTGIQSSACLPRLTRGQSARVEQAPRTALETREWEVDVGGQKANK
ncbi:hypothetical protein NN561_015198 [Cricetulus griseus]